MWFHKLKHVCFLFDFDGFVMQCCWRKDRKATRSVVPSRYRVRARGDRHRVTITEAENTTNSTRHNSTTMDPIKTAIEAIESREPGEDFSYQKVAAAHNVSRVTLAQRHQRVQSTQGVKAFNQRKLNDTEEEELIQHINRLTRDGFPPSRPQIREYILTVLGISVSDSWVSRFLHRHQAELVSKWGPGKDRSRHQADSGEAIEAYFTLLYSKINEYNVEPENTYNMDEKGFMIGVLQRTKRIFSRPLWDSKQVRGHLQDGSREWITLLACICANRTSLPASLIYPAANSAVYSN